MFPQACIPNQPCPRNCIVLYSNIPGYWHRSCLFKWDSECFHWVNVVNWYITHLLKHGHTLCRQYIFKFLQHLVATICFELKITSCQLNLDMSAHIEMLLTLEKGWGILMWRAISVNTYFFIFLNNLKFLNNIFNAELDSVIY